MAQWLIVDRNTKEVIPLIKDIIDDISTSFTARIHSLWILHHLGYTSDIYFKALRDPNDEDPIETEASKHNLSYIKLNGSIGCMVNGAGLAMATMDIIKLHGKEPANFLDVGGGASKEKVTAAFKLILADKNVKGILINIFGGIMRCDVLAQGVVEAAKQVNLSVPLVVRLAGTNFKEGKKILDNSNLKILSASDLNDAAKKIVEAIK